MRDARSSGVFFIRRWLWLPNMLKMTLSVELEQTKNGSNRKRRLASALEDCSYDLFCQPKTDKRTCLRTVTIQGANSISLYVVRKSYSLSPALIDTCSFDLICRTTGLESLIASRSGRRAHQLNILKLSSQTTPTSS
jgi:hypothetical protein